MEELVIRDPKNKRIRKLLKIDISKEIENECKRCMETVLFEQSQDIFEFFQLIDKKQTFGLIADISSCVLGIEEYQNMSEENKTKYLPNYNGNIHTLYCNLINLSSQLIFALQEFPNEVFDQVFIKNTIQSLLHLHLKFILDENTIFISQKELLSGQLLQLIKLYNSRIKKLIKECQNNNSIREKINRFITDFMRLSEFAESEFSKIEKLDSDNSFLSSLLTSFGLSIRNSYVVSKDLKQFEQRLKENEIHVSFQELTYQEKNQIECNISGW